MQANMTTQRKSIANTTITLEAFDNIPSQIMGENLEKLAYSLTQKLSKSNVIFVSKGYTQNFYNPQISEFILMLNDQILSHEKKFNLDKVYETQEQMDALADFFIKIFDTALGWEF